MFLMILNNACQWLAGMNLPTFHSGDEFQVVFTAGQLVHEHT